MQFKIVEQFNFLINNVKDGSQISKNVKQKPLSLSVLHHNVLKYLALIRRFLSLEEAVMNEQIVIPHNVLLIVLIVIMNTIFIDFYFISINCTHVRVVNMAIFYIIL